MLWIVVSTWMVGKVDRRCIFKEGVCETCHMLTKSLNYT